MKSMLAIRNKSSGMIVFFPPDAIAEAKAFRKNNPELKYARIIPIIQAYPSQIEMRKIYNDHGNIDY